MKYVEVIFKFLPAFNADSDLFVASLTAIGYEGFMEEDNELKAYIPENLFSASAIYDLKMVNNNKKWIQISHNYLEEKNWNAQWESDYKPVLINDCIVRAPFHEAPPYVNYDIVIEPKMSFGTGHHETTGMMIEMILGLDFENKTVLDMGCGTAVLSILASLKKADAVIAVDNDAWAYNNAVENCKKNNVKSCSVIKGSINEMAGKKFDVILANITRNILCAHLPYYETMQNKGGILLISGFLKKDMEKMTAYAHKYNYDILTELTKNNWAALKLYKKQ